MRFRAERPHRPPLVVVGALRAGGSGKTSVTAALALELKARGLRVGILARRLGAGAGRGSAQPVGPGSDWRIYSDEAVLLARETGCAVFAVRDRAAAWRDLRDAPFDILISDDGFQDRRLAHAFRVLLAAPGEDPGLFDLLPAGPFRETASARARADLVLEGPWPEAEPVPAGRGPLVFRRAFRPPPEAAAGPVIALAALGDAAPFLSDLSRAGIRPVAVVRGRNHAALPMARLRAAVRAHPGAKLVLTPKDAIRARDGLPIIVAGQSVRLESAVVDRILGACGSGFANPDEARRAGFPNLVH